MKSRIWMRRHPGLACLVMTLLATSGFAGTQPYDGTWKAKFTTGSGGTYGQFYVTVSFQDGAYSWDVLGGEGANFRVCSARAQGPIQVEGSTSSGGLMLTLLPVQGRARTQSMACFDQYVRLGLWPVKSIVVERKQDLLYINNTPFQPNRPSSASEGYALLDSVRR